jgi:hypothetical protein
MRVGPESERHVARKIYEYALIVAVFTIAALLVIDLSTGW